MAIAALAACVVAAVLAPKVRLRSDANGLSGTFVGLLAGVIAVLAIYAGTTRWRKERIRGWALTVAGVGVAAALIGLLRISLDAYRYAFGVAIGAIVYEVLAVITTPE